MYFERIKTTTHPLYSSAMDLYNAAFPYNERRETASQEAILQDDDYHFCLIHDEDRFVGFILFWEVPEFIYIEHFSILPGLRGRSYGKQTLSLLQREGKPVILEIDPPVDGISRRRESFYERCGFRMSRFGHIQPPFHKGDPGTELKLMAYPDPLSPTLYDLFETLIHERVMKNVF